MTINVQCYFYDYKLLLDPIELKIEDDTRYLKNAIRRAIRTELEITFLEIRLFKVNRAIDLSKEEVVPAVMPLFPNGKPLQSDLEELKLVHKISTLFPQQPLENQLHFVVCLPEGPVSNVSPEASGLKRQVENMPDPGGASTAPLRKRTRLSSSGVPSWLLDWHSKLWNRSLQRPLSRTVTLTATDYDNLCEHMTKNLPNDIEDEVLGLKSDILAAAKTSPSDSPNYSDEINEHEEPKTWFPFQIEYVDLTDLESCDRSPKLICMRSEFGLLDTLLQRHSPKTKVVYFVTGSPGIGKTVFLYLRLVRNILNGTPFLFQDMNGLLFHVSAEIVLVPSDATYSSFGEVFEALIDLDFLETHTMPVAVVRSWPGIPIIIATPPNTTFTHRWHKQYQIRVFTMQNWQAEEFWATSIFLSGKFVVESDLRRAILHFGYNPKLCFTSLSNFGLEKAAVEEEITNIKGIEHLVELLNPSTAPERSALHSFFEIVPSDAARHYYDSYLRPRSHWALEQLLQHLEVRDLESKKQFHNLLMGLPANVRGGMLAKFWELQVHSFFARFDGVFEGSVQDLEMQESKVLKWTFPNHKSVGFGTNELGKALAPFVNHSRTGYLQPYSDTFPTINSLIYTTTPPGDGLSRLVLLQITTNEQPLNVKGFQKIQNALRTSEFSQLQPTPECKWAIIFVVHKDAVENFQAVRPLIGLPEDRVAWGKKTRQFVLGLDNDQVYS